MLHWKSSSQKIQAGLFYQKIEIEGKGKKKKKKTNKKNPKKEKKSLPSCNKDSSKDRQNDILLHKIDKYGITLNFWSFDLLVLGVHDQKLNLSLQ